MLELFVDAMDTTGATHRFDMDRHDRARQIELGEPTQLTFVERNGCCCHGSVVPPTPGGPQSLCSLASPWRAAQHRLVKTVRTLQFAGGVRTVTGSKFLVRSGSSTVLFDCGLFQGLRELRALNWDEPTFDPAALDAVVITHSHVDHCGYLPRLVANGFHGPAYVTPATEELLGIVLPDSGHLQEEEAQYANQRGFTKHVPAEPLYTEDQARASLRRLRPLPFGVEQEVAPGVSVRFARAGHILGSASVTATFEPDGYRLGLSGDLGRAAHPLLVSPDPPGDVDCLLVESTYGNRRHEDAVTAEQFAATIDRTIARGGTVLIPAFAVDRTEVILYHLARLAHDGRLPHRVPIFVDSPMALNALEVYRRALQRGDPDVKVDGGVDPFDVPGLVAVRDVEGSKALNDPRQPSIIISASGMATGGRVVHHLAHLLPDRDNTVVLVGFQAEGTRGRRLLDGEQSLKMLGRYVNVRAEIVNLPAFSVHADADELVDWVASAEREPDTVYAVHGEPAASAALAAEIHRRLDWTAAVPRLGEVVRLTR